MLLFVSYARQDRPKVSSLVAGLELLHHEIWLDEQLSGGQRWWDQILSGIRRCDALLPILSPAALESHACTLERHYAKELGKSVLPILMEPIHTDLLPPDLAVVQYVDYTTPGERAAFQIAGNLAALPPAPPLPDPMPEAPPVPISYLSELGQRVTAPTLSLDEQLALVSRLRMALQRSNERDAAIDLLIKLQQRDDLYYAPAMELVKLTSQSQSSDPHVEVSTDSSDGRSAVQVELSDNSQTEALQAESRVERWHVVLDKKDKENRDLSLRHGRNLYKISYVTNRTEDSPHEELYLNGRLVGKNKSTDPWKDLWRFPIVEDAKELQVDIHISRSFWGGKINVFRVVINGKEVYADNG
jgi:TIR domain